MGIGDASPVLQKLARLANLQSMILRHALKFPGLRRLAYSTCSVSVEENEGVVEDVLRDVKTKFELVHAMPSWTRRGLHGQDECLGSRVGSMAQRLSAVETCCIVYCPFGSGPLALCDALQ